MTGKNIGADPEELASQPGLLLELSLSMVPRRLGVAHALLAMMGGISREKVQTHLNRVHHARMAMAHPDLCALSYCAAARDLCRAVSGLEDAVFTLVTARLRVGANVIPADVIRASQNNKRKKVGAA